MKPLAGRPSTRIIEKPKPDKIYKGGWRNHADFVDAIKSTMKNNRFIVYSTSKLAAQSFRTPELFTIHHGAFLFICPKWASSDYPRYKETQKLKWHFFLDEYMSLCNLAKATGASVMVLVAITDDEPNGTSGPNVYAGLIAPESLMQPVGSHDLGKFENLQKAFEVLK